MTNYTLRLIIATLLPLIACVSIHADNMDEYMARSIALQRLEELNDLLHVLSMERVAQSEYGIELSNTDGGSIFASNNKVEFAIFETPEVNGELKNITGVDLIDFMRKNFKPDTEFLAPLIYSHIKFTDISGSETDKYIELVGYLDVAGACSEEKPPTCSFYAKVSLGASESGMSGKISTLKATKLDEAEQLEIRVSTFRPWELHNDEFLDPQRSRLYIEGKTEDVGATVRPIERYKLDSEWFEKIVESGQDVQFNCQLKKQALVQAAELFRSFPHFTPSGEQGPTEASIYGAQIGSIETQGVSQSEIYLLQGHSTIKDLVETLEKDPEGLQEAIESTLRRNPSWKRSADAFGIQANLIGAWYGVLHDNLNPIHDDYVSLASHFPQVKEIALVKFFRYSSEGEYGKALEAFRVFDMNNESSIVLGYLKKSTGDLWYNYGREMKIANVHDQMLKGYCIGSRFDPRNDISRLLELSDEARRLKDLEISLDCLRKVLQEDEARSNPDLWLDMAMIEAEMGTDPEQAIAQAMKRLAGQVNSRTYCARAMYYNEKDRPAEANARLVDGFVHLKNDPQLYKTRAIIGTVPQKKKEDYFKFIKYEIATTRKVEHFKKGYTNQLLSNEPTLSPDKRNDYLKDAIFEYKKAIKKGYPSSLGYRKIGECYLALNDLEEASYHFKAAVDAGEKDGQILFTQAILTLLLNDLSGFRFYMNEAAKQDFVGSADDRSRRLFEFCEILAGLSDLIAICDDKNIEREEDQAKKMILVNNVQSQLMALNNWAAAGDQRAEAYHDFGYLIWECTMAYVKVDQYKGDEYRGHNPKWSGVLDAMNEHSDIDLHFFRDLDFIAPLKDWNKIFEENVYPEMPKRQKSMTVRYLRETDHLRDPYDYL